MSSNNGIYLAEFPDGLFRVIHVQGIVNLTYDDGENDMVNGFNVESVKSYFRDAKVFETALKAHEYAFELALEIGSYAPLEYGINDLGYIPVYLTKR